MAPDLPARRFRPIQPARPAVAARAAPPSPQRAPFELALDVDALSPTCNVAIRRADKELFDALQAWLSLQAGRRVTQWEAFGVLLAEALENQDGRLARAPLPAS